MLCWGILWAQLPIELEDTYNASFQVSRVGMVDNYFRSDILALEVSRMIFRYLFRVLKKKVSLPGFQ